MQNSTDHFFPELENYIQQIIPQPELIDDERKKILSEISEFIAAKINSGKEANLLVVCVHNSRRSHFAQVWAQVGADYFGIKNFKSFSGGAEATAVHPNTIAALQRAGFVITSAKNIHEASFSKSVSSLKLISKIFDDEENPKNNFGAVLVCVNDAQACPYIPDADVRIGLPYIDPKSFDGTVEEVSAYDLCCKTIASEMFWVMKEAAETIG
ncbi:MAG: hypothetical protein LH473_08025 [Chitinophagales bacterium]|nr:hypothetical protein [Chitinophagales bacterium]